MNDYVVDVRSKQNVFVSLNRFTTRGCVEIGVLCWFVTGQLPAFGGPLVAASSRD